MAKAMMIHLRTSNLIIEGDSKLLSEFPLIGRGNPENNLESHCTSTIYSLHITC
jgi:hypothetical protein